MAYEQIFDQAGRQYNVDPRLLMAQMQVESGGNPNVQSEKGAQGLMQIIPATQQSLGVTNPNDPIQSINAAAQLMAENLDRYGNVADAVRAYHGGTDQSAWGPKTQAYAQKVLAGYGGQPQGAQSQKAPDDGLDAYFSAPNAKGAPAPVAAPDDGLDAYFSAPKAVPAASTIAPVATDATPEAQQTPPTAGSMIGNVIDKGTQAVQDIGAGTIEGLKRGVDTPVEYLTKWMGGDYDAQVAADKARRDAYDATSPGYFGQVSKLGGEMAGPIGELGAAGKIATVGGNALLNGLRATEAGSALAPAAAQAGQFVSGSGGILSRIANMSGQGTAGAALTSGGGNPVPVEDQMAAGALIGGALPVAGGIIKGTANVGGKLLSGIRALSGSGQDAALSDLVGGVAQKSSPALADLPKGATLDDIGQAANTAPRSTAGSNSNVLQDALQGKSAGAKVGADFTEYVPGSTPTLAQATGNSGIAELERAANSQNSAPFTALEQANNNARGNFLQQIRGTPDTLADLQASRESVTGPLRDNALANPVGPADAKPVVELIDNILAGPDGKQSAVRNALNTAKAGLYDSNGALETDPSMLYGVRKEINNLIDPLAGSPTSDTKLAASQLGKVKDALDQVIEPVAPGFGNYLKTYADMSRPIEAQQFLQGKDLTDATSSQFSLNKVKNLLLGIQKMQSAPGANAAKSITPEQMQGLQALHMDLQRQANSMLGVGKNSATMQLINGNNLLNNITGGGGVVGQLAPHAVGSALGGVVGGPLGAAIGGGVGHLAGSALSETAAARSAELNSKLVDLLLGRGGPESLNILMPKAQRGSNGLTDLLSRGAGTASGAGAGVNNK